MQTYIIAEAGVNHNGDLRRALLMVDGAAGAGADAVKFQAFRASELASASAPAAAYQSRATAATTQLEVLSNLELNAEAFERIQERCRLRGIDLIVTPFDHDSVTLVVDTLKLPVVKLSSGEVTNGPLLHQTARTGVAILLSTGMCTVLEVEAALGVIAFGYLYPDAVPTGEACARALASEAGKDVLKARVKLLHCTTDYPAPFGDANLRAMKTLAEAFALPVGLSDHTLGIALPIAAVALGAAVIEKHFTLDRALPGPDHAASLEPAELAAMVQAIRQVELALGDGLKVPRPSELGNIPIVRKSLVAAKVIRRGDRFNASNLTAKRPGTGVTPMCYWEYLGRIASRDYAPDDLIEPRIEITE